MRILGRLAAGHSLASGAQGLPARCCTIELFVLPLHREPTGQEPGFVFVKVLEKTAKGEVYTIGKEDWQLLQVS